MRSAGQVFRRLRPGAMVAIALVVGVAGLLGCGKGQAASKGAGGREGSALPEVKLTALDGREYTTASLRGKVVVVDFWDTWCGPCLRAMPHLKELSTNHPDDVVVIAVALGQEGEAKVREVVAKLQLPFPVMMFEAQGDLTPAFGAVEQLPTTFLVGPDGVIQRRWVGSQSLPVYERAVKALLPS